MSEKIISEGKTVAEAVDNGLKELKVSKDKVNIKILENEDKRSFFSILAPRIVKVELTLKEDKNEKVREVREYHVSKEDVEIAKNNVEEFLKKFISKLPEDTQYNINVEENIIKIEISNKDLGYLIGYRGETLYALQNIISAIANKNTKNRVKVIFDIENYKEKRVKTLEDLAEKIARTVIKTGKPVTLEPMQAYERKIIHSKLQDNKKVETKSIGEEPRRRVVISLK